MLQQVKLISPLIPAVTDIFNVKLQKGMVQLFYTLKEKETWTHIAQILLYRRTALNVFKSQSKCPLNFYTV